MKRSILASKSSFSSWISCSRMDAPESRIPSLMTRKEYGIDKRERHYNLHQWKKVRSYCFALHLNENRKFLITTTADETVYHQAEKASGDLQFLQRREAVAQPNFWWSGIPDIHQILKQIKFTTETGFNRSW